MFLWKWIIVFLIAILRESLSMIIKYLSFIYGVCMCVEDVIEYLLSKDVDFCDARFERRYNLSVGVVNGKLRYINTSVSEGISIRVMIRGAWGYASTTDTSWDSLRSAADRAYKNAKKLCGRRKLSLDAITTTTSVRASIKVNPMDVDLEDKIDILMVLDGAQREADNRIANSNSAYSESILSFHLANSLGGNVSWEEVRIRIMAYSLALEAGNIQYSFFVRDGTVGFELIKSIDLNDEGIKVAREAVEMLSAKKPPSGLMTVIVDPSVSGVLAHEVMGHASEADEVIGKRSFLSGIVGKTIGSEAVTMIDDGTIPGAYGTIPFDSEGTRSSRTIIIENGIYRGYMHSLETAALMGLKPTGNGRAQDFNRKVFVRMTNTFFEKGDWKLEEIIEDTKEGILALKSIGGMEDPVGGGFETRVLRGYIIRNGERRELIRSFTLTGKALEILKTVDAVSREFELHGGLCGKGEEDMIPVSTGGPYMRAKILVGGG